jgi:hypothetical protein
MAKNPPLSDFVREAVREKALRELAALDQRAAACGAIERASTGLAAVATELYASTSAFPALTTDTAATAKLKKLRKAVDDARALAGELAESLGVASKSEELATARAEILDALRHAGVDVDAVIASATAPAAPPAAEAPAEG